MSAVTGNAMRMKLELAALMQKHGYAVEPHFIKSTAPVDYPLDVSGLASTTDIDLGRQKFRGWAFDNLCLALKGYPLPKLLYKHDDDQIAGRITSLGYDDKGRLRISAEVTHPLAKLCSAFSVGAKLNTYEIKDADNTNFHALITSAEITEISLTDCPPIRRPWCRSGAGPCRCSLISNRFTSTPICRSRLSAPFSSVLRCCERRSRHKRQYPQRVVRWLHVQLSGGSR